MPGIDQEVPSNDHVENQISLNIGNGFLHNSFVRKKEKGRCAGSLLYVQTYYHG